MSDTEDDAQSAEEPAPAEPDAPEPDAAFLSRLAELKNAAVAVKRTLMIDQLAHVVGELIAAIETKARVGTDDAP